MLILQQVLNHIKSAEPDTSRRQALVQTIINADKLAKIESRIAFLVRMR